MINKKILALKQLLPVIRRLKAGGKKIVTTNGVFDILHLGHAVYLEEAKCLGDVLIVGVNTDSSVKINKGDKRPINNEKSRAGVLAALASVDYVFLFNEKTPKEWLAKIKPDIHVKGGDYNLNQMIEREDVKKNGGRPVVLKLEKGCSTTNLINKIIERYA